MAITSYKSVDGIVYAYKEKEMIWRPVISKEVQFEQDVTRVTQEIINNTSFETIHNGVTNIIEWHVNGVNEAWHNYKVVATSLGRLIGLF